ncbi:MAG: DUF3822 family protein [Bacteroidota bacterium]
MGIKNIINETSFDKQQTAQYKLSILLGMDSLFYAISSGNNELLVVKDIPMSAFLDTATAVTEFNTICQQDQLLQSTYRQVKIGLFSPISTLVPQRLFDPTKISSYLKTVTPIEEHQHISRDELPTMDLSNVYAVDNLWEEQLSQRFDKCKVHHQNTLLLRSFQRLQRGKSGYALYAHVSKTFVQLYLYEGTSLLLSNIYNYKSPEDFVYYVLLIYDQFSLSPTELPVQLSGQLKKESTLYSLLYRYVKAVQFVRVDQLVEIGPNFRRATHPHQYFDLASLVVY